jgi:bacterioferritin-associated ferredoxin
MVYLMIVCHCRVRNDADIADAVRTCGADDAAAVADAAGAGDGCGSCLEAIERLIAEMQRALVTAA